MFLLLIYIILQIFTFLNCKNIVLPFDKITIGIFNSLKSLDDLINYNIYTNVTIGTPPQTVAHFIDPTEYSFNFKKKILTFGNNKFSPFLSKYENFSNFWFKEEKSSTFYKNETNGFCTDIFYFNNLNEEKITALNLKYTVPETHLRDVHKCGIIGLHTPDNLDFKSNLKETYFIHELRQNGFIDEYTFSIFYDEKYTLFDNKNDTNYGNIVIGESPHVFSPDKYNKEDLVTYKASDWSILMNSVKFNSSKGDYLKEKIDMQISINSGFIKGTEAYRLKIEEVFFNELIKKNLCIVEVMKENIYLTDFFVFSCQNTYEVDDYIKSFPSLYFELPNDLKFVFTYKDLFKLFNDRLYFMIIFKIEAILAFSPKWIMGEPFLRKYLTLFNYETREISFYRNQVELTNKGSLKKLTYDFSLFKKLKIIGGIIFALIIIVVLFLIYRKKLRSRKINAAELENDEKDGNQNEVLLEDKNN
jgi:cbb3-type cytochrome oxidase subunit 3